MDLDCKKIISRNDFMTETLGDLYCGKLISLPVIEIE